MQIQYASIDGVGLSHIAAITSFYAEKCCHLVASAHAASTCRMCSSVRLFLIHSIQVIYLYLSTCQVIYLWTSFVCCCWTYHLEQFTWISAWSWIFDRQFYASVENTSVCIVLKMTS